MSAIETEIETEAAEPTPISGVRYRCAGPRVLTDALRGASIAKRETLEAAGDHPSLVLFARNLAKSMERADKLSAEPSTTEVTEALVQLTNARKGCGTDTTEMIEALSFDGIEHAISCPTCGTVTKVTRTPRNAEDAKAADAKKLAKIVDVLK